MSWSAMLARRIEPWYAEGQIMADPRGSDDSDIGQLVRRVLSGDRRASELLATRLMPIIQKRIAEVLRRKRTHASRNDLLDYVQRTLECLWDRDFYVLRRWDPAIGGPEPYVAKVAERLTLSILRSGRLSGWREDPTESEAFETGEGGEDLESSIMNRELLEIVLDRLTEELSPRHMELFSALFVDERKVEDVSQQFQMTPAAIYSWKNRVRTLLRSLLAELRLEQARV